MTDANPLARYLLPLRRWWPIAACTLALGLVVAWVTLPQAPEQPLVEEEIDPEVAYRATEILVRGRSTSQTENYDLVLLLARQGEVANLVLERLGDRVTLADVEAIELTPDSTLGTLSVTATQPTEERAVELVETYSDALTEFFDARADESLAQQIERSTERLTLIDDRIRQLEEDILELPEESLDRRLLESEIQVLIDQYGSLQAQLRDLSTQEVSAAPTFETLQEAVPVRTESGFTPQILEVPDNSPARFAIAAVAALLLGIALIFAVDWVDTRVRTRGDAEEWFGLPVVAEVPYRPRRDRKQHPIPAHSEPGSATAEAIRTLRLALQRSPLWQLDRAAPISNGTVGSATAVNGGPRKAIVVSSAVTGEGKSSLAANLAAGIAEAGQQVLVVDCDFRRSSIATLLGAEDGPGLRDLPSPDASDLAGLVRRSTVPRVRVIRSGEPGIAPHWFLSDTEALVAEAREMADVVVFDVGPLLATNEAAALVPHVDALLLVTRSGRVPRDKAKRTTEQLARLAAKVAGVALVGGDGSRRYGYYEPIRKAAAKGESVETWTAGGSSTRP